MTDAGNPPPAVVKEKRKKRKLTLDLLKETRGIPDVFHTFPDTFRKQCRGKGHEAGDLRRLLEMYIRWQVGVCEVHQGLLDLLACMPGRRPGDHGDSKSHPEEYAEGVCSMLFLPEAVVNGTALSPFHPLSTPGPGVPGRAL